MSSLTESSLISGLFTDIDTPREPKKNNNWYDRIYLCLENENFKSPTTFGQTKDFKCYRYNSFESANKDLDKKFGVSNKINIKHIMIPICKWSPLILDKYILDWKFKNIYDVR